MHDTRLTTAFLFSRGATRTGIFMFSRLYRKRLLNLDGSETQSPAEKHWLWLRPYQSANRRMHFSSTRSFIWNARATPPSEIKPRDRAQGTGQLTVTLGRELPRHSFTGRIHLSYRRFAIPRPRPDLLRRYPKQWRPSPFLRELQLQQNPSCDQRASLWYNP